MCKLARSGIGAPLSFTLIALLCLAFFSVPSRLRAADFVLQTGTGNPLQTVTVPLEMPAINALPQLRFEIAFATDEIPQAGTFHDSVSFTLQTADESSTALLLTMDAFGLQAAPPNPGGFPIPPGALQIMEIPYFGSAGDPAMRAAYAVLFTAPMQFTEQANNSFFDLFDNLDPVSSVAHLRNVTVVPEPQLAWILLSGLGIMALFQRMRR